MQPNRQLELREVSFLSWYRLNPGNGMNPIESDSGPPFRADHVGSLLRPREVAAGA